MAHPPQAISDPGLRYLSGPTSGQRNPRGGDEKDGHRRLAAEPRPRFARDSPLEGTGFELLVPPSRKGLSVGCARPPSYRYRLNAGERAGFEPWSPPVRTWSSSGDGTDRPAPK